MEIIDIFRVAVDSGLLVLIWMVQRIVYPSFLHIKPEDFQEWHRAYTRIITYIVMPLMFGQVFIYGFLLFESPALSISISAVLIAFIWIQTFWFFVPFHTKMTKNEEKIAAFRPIIRKNWVRTVFWTVIWVITLMDLLL